MILILVHASLSLCVCVSACLSLSVYVCVCVCVCVYIWDVLWLTTDPNDQFIRMGVFYQFRRTSCYFFSSSWPQVSVNILYMIIYTVYTHITHRHTYIYNHISNWGVYCLVLTSTQYLV